MRKTMTQEKKEDKDKEENEVDDKEDNEDNDKKEREDDDTVACLFVCCFYFFVVLFCFSVVLLWFLGGVSEFSPTALCSLCTLHTEHIND